MRRAIAVTFPLVTVLLSTCSLAAQVGGMRVTTPSPTAASLGKFGDIPVALYSGVPDISIPLFMAKGRTLELPIVLKYHAAGIRVEEIGGWVGIGWALEAGGTITRTVRGVVDEHAGGYYCTGNTWYSSTNWPDPPLATLYNLEDEQVDGEPDQFFFDFAGRSGQFVMGPTTTDQAIKEYRAIPYQKLRIEPGATLSCLSGSDITSWVITAEDGTRYTFGAVEWSTDWNQTIPTGYFPPHYGEQYTSSWHLTEIRSPGGDVITLTYTPYSVRHVLSTYREKFDFVTGMRGCVPSQSDVINEYSVSTQYLASITTAAHTITFTPGATLRSDARSPTGAQQEPRLDKITVSTPPPASAVLRIFQFEHDYSVGNPGRLTLKNVYEQDRNGVSLPPYSFTYGGPLLPARTSYALDHWGFYNGRTTNATSIPAGLGPGNLSLDGADRDPDTAYMRAGALTRITYPTGGYNEFVYETNDYGRIGGDTAAPKGYGPPQDSYLFGGPFQGFVSQTFTVGGTQPTTATVTIDMDPSNCGTQVGCPYTEISGVGAWTAPGTHSVTLAPGTYTQRAWDGDLGGFASIDVVWRDYGVVQHDGIIGKLAGGLRVAELRTADAMGNITIRKYKYTLQSDPSRSSGIVSVEPAYSYTYNSSECSYFSRSSMSRMPLGNGPPVGYREVTVWLGTNGEYGKTRHTFRSVLDAADPGLYFANGWPFSTRTSYEWQRGQETGATDYNASGQTQRRTGFAYTFATDAQTYRSFRGMSINVFIASGVYNPFEVISGWQYMNEDTTVTYDEPGSGSFSTVRTYTYGNPAHLQPTQVTETNSNGTQRITRMKYPADYATGSGNDEAVALTVMQGTANIQSPVIERWVSEKVGANETVVQAELTTFKTYAAGQYLPYQRFVLSNPSGVTSFSPSSVTNGSFTKDFRYLQQVTANTYDTYGRIMQLTDARNQVTNYLYGGNVNNAFLAKVTRVHDVTGTVDLVTDIAYDTDGFVSSIKDEGGTFRYFTYDLYGRLRQVKNNAGMPVTAYGYTYSRNSGNGWTFQPTSPNAVADTTFMQQTPTVKVVVSTGYLDGLGRAIQTVMQDGTDYHVTATQYDVMGRTWRVWRPYRRPTAGYDANFVTTATDSANAYHATSNAKPYTETAYTPDALSRVKQVTPEYIGTAPSAFVVTAYGVVPAAKQTYTEVTDESGKKTRTLADLFGNTVISTLGYGATEATTTTFIANVLGQRTQATDPRGVVTTSTFDTRGLLTARTNPDAGTVSSKYDKAGNLRFSQDANQAAAGQVYFFNYDFAGRQLTSGLGAATFSALNADATEAVETTQGNWLVVRAYDAKPSTAAFPWSLFSSQISPLTLANVSGRLAAVASKSGSAWQVTLFSYDADGQVATRYVYTQDNAGAGVLTALNTTVTYLRDLRGAQTERDLVVGSNTFYHWYDYDSRGLLSKTYAATTSTKPGTADVTDTYRPSGQPQDYQFLGGPLVPIRYTIRGQTEQIGDPAITTYPFSAHFVYNPNGTVSQAEFYSAGSPASQKRYRYDFPTYDALNRLKTADYTGWNGSSWAPTLAYDVTGMNYDVAGNLTALQRYRETGTLIDNLTYSYPTNSNRLSSVADAVSGNPETWDARGGNFSYDANGNIIAAPAPYSFSAATYSPQNLPLSLARSGVTTTYRYDDAGERITKQVGTGNTEVYLREGATPLAVFTVNSSGTPVSWYFNLLWADRVVGRQSNTGNRSYYHFDILGSTRAVTQGATVVESHDYDPWGLEMPARGLGSGTKEGFSGKEQDAETGLDYFGARNYMPALGRWAAVDPAADKYPEWSAYNYGMNNPGSVIDPTGRETIVLTGVEAQWLFSVLQARFRGCPLCSPGDPGVRTRSGFWNRVVRGLEEPCTLGDASDCRPALVVGVVPDVGPSGRGLVTAVERVVEGERRAGTLIRHARNLRGLLMHVTPDDLSGAVKQLHGLESGGRHLQEVREAIGGLREFLADMRGAMSDPHLTVAERNLYSRFIGLASRALDAAEAAMGR